MIGLLLGYPHEMWPKLMEWSERTIVGGGGPRYVDDDVIIAAFEFAGACAELYEEKQRCPADDIMTVWTTAEIDGEPLGLDRVITDCLLLLDGGAETTRTVIARTILELGGAARSVPAAARRRRHDRGGRGVHPLGHAGPQHVPGRRRATTRSAARPSGQGQQVVLMYPSANRDPAHFDDPDRYDVTRTPNHHIAFGFGTHFCLGAALARLEIRMFFDEFVRRVSADQRGARQRRLPAQRVRERRHPRRGRARLRLNRPERRTSCTTSRSPTAPSSTAPARRASSADVAVKDGAIVEVSAGRRSTATPPRPIDATGLLVTPGFVDIHTHYDGQVTWDPLLEPSCGTASPRWSPATAASGSRRCGPATSSG